MIWAALILAPFLATALLCLVLSASRRAWGRVTYDDGREPEEF